MEPTCSIQIMQWLGSIAVLFAGAVAIWWAIRGNMANKRRGARWAWGLLGLLMIVWSALRASELSSATSAGIDPPTFGLLKTLRAEVAGAIGGVVVTLALFGELMPRNWKRKE